MAMPLFDLATVHDGNTSNHSLPKETFNDSRLHKTEKSEEMTYAVD